MPHNCSSTCTRLWVIFWAPLLCLLPLLFISTSLNAATLSLTDAVQTAQDNDLWLRGNQHQQDSIESMSVAANTLPDPKVSVGISNLPTDSFDFGQENMTQLMLGVAQVFPRGDTLAIKQQQLQLLGSQYPHQRQNRRAKVAVTVAQLWLDAYKAQQSIALIEQDRSLFEQLADVAEASYSSALGKTRQQDIVRAQLELTRLDDRLTVLNQQRDVALQRLGEWRSVYFTSTKTSAKETADDSYGLTQALQTMDVQLDKNLPNIPLLEPQLFQSPQQTSPDILHQYFLNHAAIKNLEQKIKASHTGIELAKQKYKPEWGVNASYGHREQNPMGQDRADLFSMGVSFDVPLFTENKQDKEVESAVSQTEAVRTEKFLLLRQMMASFEASKAQLLRLDQRQKLYRRQLLPQIHVQAEASLTAYTNDDGDFAEVVRARIAELNANIDALDIDVERQKTRVQLNYFFMKNPNQIIHGENSSLKTASIATALQGSHHE